MRKTCKPTTLYTILKLLDKANWRAVLMFQLRMRMCSLEDDGLKKKEEAIPTEMVHPQYICKKCPRISTNKDLLCSPKKLE